VSASTGTISRPTADRCFGRPIAEVGALANSAGGALQRHSGVGPNGLRAYSAAPRDTGWLASAATSPTAASSTS
jgi:hypothetical protein